MSAVRPPGAGRLRRVWHGSATGAPPLWLATRLPLLVLASLIPLLFPGAHVFDIAQAVALYGVLAVGYAVVFGLCGQFSVAHAALMAVGAYTTAILTSTHDQSMTLALGAAVGAGAVAGALLGLPALRLSGDQLAIVTLFAGGVVQLVLQNGGDLTGGTGGITDVPVTSVLGHNIVSLRDEYLLTAVALIVCTVLVERLRRSGLGLAMLAVREDEVAARAAGIRAGAVKVLAFAVSGAVAGLAGWIYAGRYATVTPARFDTTLSVLIAVMVLLGGAGRTYGAVVGAGILGTLERVLAEHSAVEDGATGLAIVTVVLARSGAFRDLALRLPKLRRGRA